MSVIVLCNVGARHVSVDGQYPRPVRQAGQDLLQRYGEIKGALAFPIIQPCLAYIAAQETKGIDHVYLFGTDQSNQKHRPSDTIGMAQLAARRLPELMPGRIGGATALAIDGINPAMYDEALQRFDTLLGQVCGPVATCYVILCGGTPACNTALLLQGVRHYGSNLRTVYLPQQGEAQEMRTGQQVIGAFKEAAAIDHLQRLDFANARLLMEGLGAPAPLIGLAAYSERRLSFDFASAQTTLLAVIRDGEKPIRDFVNQSLRHSLDNLLDSQTSSTQQLLTLLCELFWNAEITYNHHRFADFLGRIYRFQEAVLRYLVEAIFELPTDMDRAVRAQNQEAWNNGIRSNPALLAFLDAQTIDGRKLDWSNVSRPTYQALLSYAIKEDGRKSDGSLLLPKADRDRYAAVVQRVAAFDRLVELRHHTIIGHGFAGVSKEAIEKQYAGKVSHGHTQTPVEGLAQILSMLGANVKENPYCTIAGFLVQQMKRRPV